MRTNFVRLLVSVSTVLFGHKGQKVHSRPAKSRLVCEDLENRLTPAGYPTYPGDLQQVGEESFEQHSKVSKPLGSDTKLLSDGSFVDTKVAYWESKDIFKEKYLLANDEGGTGFDANSSQVIFSQTTTTITTSRPDGSGTSLIKYDYTWDVKYGNEDSYQLIFADIHNADVQAAFVKGFRTELVTFDGKGGRMSEWTGHEDVAGAASHDNHTTDPIGRRDDVFYGTSNVVQDSSGKNWNFLNGISKYISSSVQKGRVDMQSSQASYGRDGSYNLNHTVAANDFTTNAEGTSYYLTHLNWGSSSTHSFSKASVVQVNENLDAQKNYSRNDVSQQMTWEGLTTWKDSYRSTLDDDWTSNHTYTSHADVTSSFDITTLNKDFGGTTIIGTATNQFVGTKDTLDIDGFSSMDGPFANPVHTQKKVFKDDPKITLPVTTNVNVLKNMLGALANPEEVLDKDPAEWLYDVQAAYGMG